MNTKQFLSRLNWGDNDENFFPVFSQEEIDNTPLKWLKHLFLVRIGLRDYQELIREIKRFAMSEQGIKLTQQASEELLNSAVKKDEQLLIIKVVFSEITIALPNYRINYVHQLDAAFSDIRQKFMQKAIELWVCLSNISRTGSNFGGRVAMDLGEMYVPEIIEVIWYTSPRILDGFQVTNYPYIKSSKFPGSMHYKIDRIQKPQQYNQDNSLEIKMMNDYRYALFELHKRNEKIREMCQVLSKNGVKELVLQFKVNNGIFTIIDWDTDKDVSGMLRKRSYFLL